MREMQPDELRAPEPQIRVLTAKRLRGGGRSPGQIRTLVRNGSLVAIGHGIYVTRAMAAQFKKVPHGDHVLRATAAVALSGRGCVVSHQSAALLHDIDLVGDEITHVTLSSRTGRRG